MMDDRLTRCPHCSTCFAVSDIELQQAFGVARCGRCKKIFNAANHLFELEADQSSSVPNEIALTSSESFDTQTYQSFASEATETAAEIKTQPDKKTFFSEPASPSQSEDEGVTDKNKPETYLDSLPDTPDMQMTDNELSAIRKTRQAPEHRHHQLEVSLSADKDEESSGFTTDLSLSAEPDQPHQKPKAKEKRLVTSLPTMPWVPATLAAGLILLIFIVLWSNTRTLSQSPGLSGFAEAICGITGCEHLLPSDFDQLSATQMAVIESDNQLTAELVLNNPSSTPLPFPAILLELRDRSGKVLYEVIYQPDSYLQGKPFADHMLPPELPVALTFPIQAQVKNAENVSVRYYPAATR